MSTSPDKAVTLPRYLRKEVMTFSVLVELLLPLSPARQTLPHQTYHFLRKATQGWVPWYQEYSSGPRLITYVKMLISAAAMEGLENKKGQHGYAVGWERGFCFCFVMETLAYILLLASWPCVLLPDLMCRSGHLEAFLALEASAVMQANVFCVWVL